MMRIGLQAEFELRLNVGVHVANDECGKKSGII